MKGAPGWPVIERQRRSWPAGYVIVPIALVVGSLQVLIPSASDRGGWSQDREQASPQAQRQPQPLPVGRSAELQRPPLPGAGPLADSQAGEATAVGPGPTRVFIHHRAGTRNAVPAIQLAAYLQEHGFAVTDIRAVDSHIEQPSVRYFFADDRPDSRRLVEAIAAFFADAPGQAPDEAVDFSHFSPKPQPGDLEVWLPDPRDDETS